MYIIFATVAHLCKFNFFCSGTFQVAYGVTGLEYSVVCFDSLHPYIDLPNFCKYS